MLVIALLKPPFQHTSATPATLKVSTAVIVDTELNKPEQPKPEPQVEVASVSEPAPQVQQETVTYPLGCENYVAIASQYNWDVTVALNIMRAESGCNPYAIGDNRVIGGIYAPSCGLMQIRTLAGRPTCEQLQDPATNIAWAYKLYASGGWYHWSVCRTTVACY